MPQTRIPRDPEVQAVKPDSAARPVEPAAGRAAQRLMARRRLRVWLNVGAFLVVTVLMVLVSMAGRDYESMHGCEAHLQYTRSQLEQLLAEGQIAPARLPLGRPEALPENASPAQRDRVEQDQFTLREHYLYNGQYGRRQAPGRQVGVACCQRPHRLLLRPDGRNVLTFDGTHYQVRWLTEAEFRQQAAALAFPVPEER